MAVNRPSLSPKTCVRYSLNPQTVVQCDWISQPISWEVRQLVPKQAHLTRPSVSRLLHCPGWSWALEREHLSLKKYTWSKQKRSWLLRIGLPTPSQILHAFLNVEGAFMCETLMCLFLNASKERREERLEGPREHLKIQTGIKQLWSS